MEHSEILKELMGEYEITHLRDTVGLMESSDYKDRFKGSIGRLRFVMINCIKW